MQPLQTRADRELGGPSRGHGHQGLPDGGEAACLGDGGRVCCEAGAVSSICRAAGAQRYSHGSPAPGEALLAPRPLLKQELFKDNRQFQVSPTRRGGGRRKVKLHRLQAV